MSKIREPFVGAGVLVRTPAAIAGQHEHAAIVTRLAGSRLSVMLLPPEGAPYPIHEVEAAGAGAPAAIVWRWPPKSA